MPNDSNVRSFEEESFKKRLASLSRSGSVSDADFADLIYTALTRFGIGEQDFRDAFGLTGGAVERWCSMKNLPQPTVRPKILGWILTHLTPPDSAS